MPHTDLPGSRRSGCERRPRGLVKLLFLGRARERRDRRAAALYDLRYGVEVTGADFALVPGRGVAEALGGEFGFLQRRVCGHAFGCITSRQIEHAEVDAVETRERDELELVTHRAELALEACDRCAVEMAF